MEIISLKKNFYTKVESLNFKKIVKQIFDAWQTEDTYKTNVPFGSYHDYEAEHNKRFNPLALL